MTTATTTPTRELLGNITIAGTTYSVFRLPCGMKSRAMGIRNRFAIEGPKGGQFFVTDFGPAFTMTSVSINGFARPLRGLKREHLAAFGVEA